MRALIVGGARSVGGKQQSSSSSNSDSKDENNSIATPTPTRQRPPRPPLLRTPLGARDHNAIMRQTSPLMVKSSNGNTMAPYDKQNSRSPLPTLAAKAGSNRTPLTPRVAAPTPAAASTRLAPRSDVAVVPAREELLSHNITPRSGSRKNRVDSANTTPTGTPTGTPVIASSNESFRFAQDPPPPYGSGLGINGLDRDPPKRPAVSFSTTGSDVGYTRSPLQPDSVDSKFFFASQAKAVQTPKPQPKAAASFVYANGDVISPPPKSSGGSVVGSATGGDRPRFYHANGSPDFQIPPTPHFPPRPASTVSKSTRMTSPKPGGNLSPPQRPVSPSKLNQHASTSSLKSAPSLPSPVVSRPLQGGRGQSVNSIVASGKANIEVSKKVFSRSRTPSLGSPDVSQRRMSSGSLFEALSSSMSLNLVTNSLPVSTPEEIQDDVDQSADTGSDIQSPIKAGNSIETMNELAANARRERKVLDLEITNSSLAAINRTLEREMRKQTAELRRFRRLSRTGRLSLATSGSRRTSSLELSAVDGSEGTALSDMSEEENDSEEGSDYDSEEESVDDGSLSPGAMAESDARHRERDEKRLKLDLSKHQQLLIDSQKMNQSLKRCLSLSEELINEGKKAIAYTVRVSDVQIGGRVLAPEEVEDENEGMSDIGASLLKQVKLAVQAAWVEGREDRDSGIEINGPSKTPTFEPQ